MSLKGNFIIYDVDKNMTTKINSYFKLARNTLNMLKRNRNQKIYQKWNKFQDNRKVLTEFANNNIPNLKITSHEVSFRTPIEYLQLHKFLKGKLEMENSPLFYGSVILFDGYINESKKYLFDLLQGISNSCNCKIYVELEMKNKKNMQTYTYLMNICEKQQIMKKETLLPNYHNDSFNKYLLNYK